MFRRLAHSWMQKHSRDNKTRQRRPYSKPYTYRKHGAQTSQTPTEHRNTLGVVSSGRHGEAVGPSPPALQIASDLRFAIRITNRNRTKSCDLEHLGERSRECPQKSGCCQECSRECSRGCSACCFSQKEHHREHSREHS